MGQAKNTKAKTKATRNLSELLRAWLKERQIPESLIKPDNDAPGFFRGFPAKSPEVDQQFLETRLWWWRYANEQGCARIFDNGLSDWPKIMLPIFQDHFERSSYLYELAARYKKRYAHPFGHSWIFCSNEERRMLDCLWPNPGPFRHWLPSLKDHRLFVRLHYHRFNLSLNDSVLVEQFRKAIQQERKLNNIDRPKPGYGIRRRPISWKPIELMDLRYFTNRVLNESERSQVSKAMADYKLACKSAAIIP